MNHALTKITRDPGRTAITDMAAFLEGTLSHFDVNGHRDHYDIVRAIQAPLQDYLDRFSPIIAEHCLEEGNAFAFIPAGLNPNRRTSYTVYALRPTGPAPLAAFEISALPTWEDMLRANHVKRRQAEGRDGFEERIAVTCRRLTRLDGRRIRNIRMTRETALTALADPYDLSRPLRGERSACVDSCMDALMSGGMIDPHSALREEIRHALYMDLSRHDTDRFQRAFTVFAGYLDRDRVDILLKAPSCLTTDSYNALSLVPVAARPILFDFLNRYPVAIPGLLSGGNESLLKNPYKPEQHVFKTGDPAILEHYAGLSENVTGVKIAREISRLAPYFNMQRHKFPFDDRQDWDHFHDIAMLAEKLAAPQLLRRPSAKMIYNDIANSLKDRKDWAYFSQTYAERDDYARQYMKRLGYSLLVPKLIARAGEQNLALSFNQAAYMALHEDAEYSANNELRRLKKAHQPSVMQEWLEPVPANDLLHQMLNFAIGYEREEAENKTRSVRNALFRNAAQYGFPALPELEIDGYKITPIRSMADLLEESFACGHDLWRGGADAVTGDYYFASVRKAKTGKIAATTQIGVTQNGDLTVVETALAQGQTRSNYAAVVVEDYINHPAIRDFPRNRHEQQRQAVQRTISSQGNMTDKIGHDPYNAVQNRQACERLRAYIPFSFGIDGNGCLSTPELDSIVNHALGLAGLKKKTP